MKNKLLKHRLFALSLAAFCTADLLKASDSKIIACSAISTEEPGQEPEGASASRRGMPTCPVPQEPGNAPAGEPSRPTGDELRAYEGKTPGQATWVGAVGFTQRADTNAIRTFIFQSVLPGLSAEDWAGLGTTLVEVSVLQEDDFQSREARIGTQPGSNTPVLRIPIPQSLFQGPPRSLVEPKKVTKPLDPKEIAKGIKDKITALIAKIKQDKVDQSEAQRVATAAQPILHDLDRKNSERRDLRLSPIETVSKPDVLESVELADSFTLLERRDREINVLYEHAPQRNAEVGESKATVRTFFLQEMADRGSPLFSASVQASATPPSIAIEVSIDTNRMNIVGLRPWINRVAAASNDAERSAIWQELIEQVLKAKKQKKAIKEVMNKLSFVGFDEDEGSKRFMELICTYKGFFAWLADLLAKIPGGKLAFIQRPVSMNREQNSAVTVGMAGHIVSVTTTFVFGKVGGATHNYKYVMRDISDALAAVYDRMEN